MRITQQNEKHQRLDFLSLSGTFPEDYLPYTSSYHRRAPYLVWGTENRKKRKWGCCNNKWRHRWWRTALPCALALALTLLMAVVAASIYLGWVTHLKNTSVLSLTGKLRVLQGDEFTDILLNETSTEFKVKAAKYEEMLDAMYSGSRLKNSLIKAQVFAFREGSLEVYFNIYLEKTEQESNEVLATEASQLLQEEIDKGPTSAYLRDLQVETQSLAVVDLDSVPSTPEEQYNAVTQAVISYNSPSPTTTSLPIHNYTINTSTRAPVEEYRSTGNHRNTDQTLRVNFGPWRPLPTTPRPAVFSRRPTVTQSAIEAHRLGPITEYKNPVPVTQPSRTVTTESSKVRSEVILESPSLRLNKANLRYVGGYPVYQNDHSSKTSTESSTTSIKSPSSTQNTFSTTFLKATTSSTTFRPQFLPEISVGAPLVIRSRPGPGSVRKIDFGTPGNTVKNNTGDETKGRPGSVDFARPSEVVKNNSYLEVPVEASLSLNRPGQGIVIPVELLPEPQDNPTVVEGIVLPLDLFPELSSTREDNTDSLRLSSLLLKPDSKKVVAGGGVVTVTTEKPRTGIPVRTVPGNTSKELTVGASLFIHANNPLRPTRNRQSTVQPPPEVKPAAPFYVRGSNKGQAYLPYVRRPATNLTAWKEEGYEEAGSIPKIISQYVPYNGGAYETKGHDDDDNTKNRFSLNEQAYVPKTPRPLLKPEFSLSGQDDLYYTTNSIESSSTQSVSTSSPGLHFKKIQDIKSNHADDARKPKPKECRADEDFTCKDRTCVTLSALCNRQKECPDASDEANCTCADYLRATNVFNSKICDGIVDCWDFSDETECSWCSKNSFVCPGAKSCVPQVKVCDGVPDCPGAEDEASCVKLYSKSTQSNEGYLTVRKNGEWGRLCVNNFPVISNDGSSVWTLAELGQAVCNSLSYRGLVSAEQIKDPQDSSRTYFKMDEATQEHVIGPSKNLLKSECRERDVLKVSCKSLECGLRPLSLGFRRRIVGGQSSAFGSWPWQVALYKEGEFQCGAVIVKEHWLLSAGHCFYHSKGAHWTARMGLLRRGSEIPSPYEQLRVITHIHLHPHYVDRGFINDIVLLRTDRPIVFGENVRPVCLPSLSEGVRSWEGKLCTAIGWGKLFELGRIFPDTLQEVQLPVISTEECRKRTSFLPLYKITDNMFCAGYEHGGRDACLGDSGGPLMCQKSDGRWSLIGVTSNGDGCGRPGRPGVYTKVFNYLEWIHSVTENSSSGPIISAPCKGHRCQLGKCLPPKRVCDGVMDCWDNSDEHLC